MEGQFGRPSEDETGLWFADFCQPRAVVTNIDLAEAVGFDWAAASASIQDRRPGMPVFGLSTKSGQGSDDVDSFLVARLAETQTAATVRTSHTGRKPFLNNTEGELTLPFQSQQILFTARYRRPSLRCKVRGRRVPFLVPSLTACIRRKAGQRRKYCSN